MYAISFIHYYVQHINLHDFIFNFFISIALLAQSLYDNL